MKKLVRPTMWGFICLCIAMFMFGVDLSECLTQSLVVIPIYRTGILTILWSDYILITAPVACVWLALSYGYWNPGGTK